jgi:hypothetical protein
MEGKAKFRHLSKLTCKGTLRQCLSVLGLERHTPLAHCIRVYSVLIHTGKWGVRVEPERRLEAQQFTKPGQKYQHDGLYLQSINSNKQLAQSPFTGKFFKIMTLCFGVYIVNYSMVLAKRRKFSFPSKDSKHKHCLIRKTSFQSSF